jgi:hypothetical protein
LSDQRAKPLEILDRIKALSHQTCVSPFDIAVIQIGVGNLTSAFEQLEEAFRQRAFRLIELTMPMFDDLRPDPRWKSLVHIEIPRTELFAGLRGICDTNGQSRLH